MVQLHKDDQERLETEIESKETEEGRTLVLRGNPYLDDPNYEEVKEFKLEPYGRIPDDYLLEALRYTMGNVSEAARVCNIDRSVFYHRARDVKGFREQMQEIKEIKLDFAESQFFEYIKQGDKQSLMFYLARQGKSRGWGSQVEVVGDEKRPININIGNVAGDDFEDYG